MTVLMAPKSDTMVKPDKLFTMRKDNPGAVMVLSIRDDRMQEAADDLWFILGKTRLKGKSEVILDCLHEMARLIEENPEMGRFLEEE